MYSDLLYVQVLFLMKSLELHISSLTLEATPLATPFFKSAYTISHLPQLSVSWVDLPSFATLSNIEPNFSNKVFFFNLKLSKNHRNKKLLFFNEKKFRLIRMIFDIENSL